MKKIFMQALPVSKNKHKIILFTLFICSVFTGKAQNQNINLPKEAITIQQIFQEIEKQTDMSVDYNQSRLDVTRQITLSSAKILLSTVLDEVLEKSGLTYSIDRGHIIIKQGTASSLASATQQKKTVTGKIIDNDGEAVIGANVVEKGTTNGIITDMDGKFSLSVSDNATLEITYIGYLTQNIPVGNQTNLFITLKEDAQAIDEVVVVGYGVQKKVNLTGAVTQVTSKVLENRAITNLSQGLQGVIPNLNVTFDGGSPGSDPILNIRGVATIRSNDNSEPLILVDGVQMRLNMLNPEDIESISVLKDAASAAIYGARGAFGVILITTKSGKKERKPTIDYSGSIQLNTHTYLPDLLSAVDYMEASNESSFNNTDSYKYNEDQVRWVKEYNADPLNNPVYHMLDDGKIFWNGGNNNYKQMLQKWAPIHKHTLSINGGGEQINFYASIGYMGQEGMFKDHTDKFDRYNFLANINANITGNFRLGFKASYSQTVYDEPHRYTGKGSSWCEQMTRGEPQILFP
ncbi:MAG: SusC/RagA family TonB-linked outer membrane protein, partial [Prevotella sp.]|nr:SusC/RagA family TonB-linked outer membrane protein [Prevotella sp.]